MSQGLSNLIMAYPQTDENVVSIRILVLVRITNKVHPVNKR